ncbi:MAG: hypothetical protein FWD15_03760 [Alphaproteobacteria bacterium]|nr:hypothetical protein [Alphaproteobacteria bacterium]
MNIISPSTQANIDRIYENGLRNYNIYTTPDRRDVKKNSVGRPKKRKKQLDPAAGDIDAAIRNMRNGR